MKILVFEYITGGGFNKQAMPDELATEGWLMLNGLLEGLVQIHGIEIVVMLDWRVVKTINTAGLNTYLIGAEDQTLDKFECLAQTCDAVWPVAPEFDGILHRLCQRIERLNKRLLTSPSKAVALAGNKWLTYKQLTLHKIRTVATERLQSFCYRSGEWIIKSVDGAGCSDSYVVRNFSDYSCRNEQLSAGQFIIQPHLQGEKTSLSCLFKQSQGWLLSVNRQRFDLQDQQYHLHEIVVNDTDDLSQYQPLVDDIAKAFPDLWGYVGIDLIETSEAIYVLEINPRLTTSFIALHEALGVNSCQCVLDLLNGDPRINRQHSVPVVIKLKQDKDEI